MLSLGELAYTCKSLSVISGMLCGRQMLRGRQVLSPPVPTALG